MDRRKRKLFEGGSGLPCPVFSFARDCCIGGAGRHAAAFVPVHAALCSFGPTQKPPQARPPQHVEGDGVADDIRAQRSNNVVGAGNDLFIDAQAE